jgi:hypothetical protein
MGDQVSIGSRMRCWMNDDALISTISQNISENESWLQAWLQTGGEIRVV